MYPCQSPPDNEDTSMERPSSDTVHELFTTLRMADPTHVFSRAQLFTWREIRALGIQGRDSFGVQRFPAGQGFLRFGQSDQSTLSSPFERSSSRFTVLRDDVPLSSHPLGRHTLCAAVVSALCYHVVLLSLCQIFASTLTDFLKTDCSILVHLDLFVFLRRPHSTYCPFCSLRQVILMAS